MILGLFAQCRIMAPHHYSGTFENTENKSMETKINVEDSLMKELKIRSHYNYDHEKQNYEKNTGTTQTVPDSSYTIRELLENFTTGITPDMHSYDNYMYNDIDEVDLSDALDEPFLTDNVDSLTSIDNVKEEHTRLKEQLRDSSIKKETQPVNSDKQDEQDKEPIQD